MRFLVIVAAATSITTSPTPSIADERTDMAMDYCEMLGTTAELVMILRQSNRNVSEVIDLVNQVDLDSEHAELNNDIVLRAYEKPLYDTDEHKERSKQTFRNEIETDCLRDNL